MQEEVEQASRFERTQGSQAMQTPEDVQAMLKLASLGWGAKCNSSIQSARWLSFTSARTVLAFESSINPSYSIPSGAHGRPHLCSVQDTQNRHGDH